MIIIHFELSRSNLGSFGLGQIWSSANSQRIPSSYFYCRRNAGRWFLLPVCMAVWISAFSETVKPSIIMDHAESQPFNQQVWVLLMVLAGAAPHISIRGLRLLKPAGGGPWVPSLKNQGSLYSHATFFCWHSTDWSILIHFDPFWSILIHFDPFWSILIHWMTGFSSRISTIRIFQNPKWWSDRWPKCSSQRIWDGSTTIRWYHTHRIHGAGIYANMTGGILMGSMLPVFWHTWIRHGIQMDSGSVFFLSLHPCFIHGSDHSDSKARDWTSYLNPWCLWFWVPFWALLLGHCVDLVKVSKVSRFENPWRVPWCGFFHRMMMFLKWKITGWWFGTCLFSLIVGMMIQSD